MSKYRIERIERSLKVNRLIRYLWIYPVTAFILYLLYSYPEIRFCKTCDVTEFSLADIAVRSLLGPVLIPLSFLRERGLKKDLERASRS